MKNKNDRKLYIGGTILFILLLLVAFSGILFGKGDIINTDLATQPPSPQHIFGTDPLGRDVLSRSFIGMRLSLLLGFIAQLICFVIGVMVGSISAYFGGILDKVFVFLQNVILSFPSMVLIFCISMLLGTGVFSMMVALCIFGWLSYARLTRSQVRALKDAAFVKGAKAVGNSTFAIIFRHIVPNVIRTVVPMFTLMIGHAVLGIAGLSFLGFGVQPPNAEIGLMIRDGMTYIRTFPWLFVFPGLVLAVYSVLLNVVSDALQDRLDIHDSTNISSM
ncbi:MAG: ABC transporter permease [Eubacteriaceae bacterium]|nr:ABC transporter permease [Eubacteriaceae bacterium]